MKAPVRLVKSENPNIYADRGLLKESSRKTKTRHSVMSLKINKKIYSALEKESNRRSLVMTEIIREALTDYIEQPNKIVESKLLKDNEIAISFSIDVIKKKQMEQIKTDNKISQCKQVRSALINRFFSSGVSK